MKRMNLILVALLMVVTVNAAPRSLHDGMKTMKQLLRSIASQVSNPGVNNQTATLADEFVQVTTDTKAFLPRHISADQAVRYRAMMDRTADLGRQLAAALRSNDNRKAAALVDDLNDSKR